MVNMLFVNLAVKEVQKSEAFFTALGFSFNRQFQDEKSRSLVLSDHNGVMLLEHDKFQSFTSREIADTTRTTEALLAISLDSREAVEKMLADAIAAGGKEHRPTNDMGFMFGGAFEDLDGHIWEPFWMDPAAVNPDA